MINGMLYLTIGDSTTWTVGTGDGLYTHLVYKYICDNYKQIKFINKGIGGSNSSNLVTNINWLGKFEPDILTIGIGMNDANGGGSDVTTYKANLTYMINNYRKKNPNVFIILCTPNTIDVTQGGRSNIALFRTAMQEVGASMNCQVARFENAWSTGQVATYTQDGVHPNDSGHSLLFNTQIKPILDTWIATKP
jgi:lysophospholipase L1-like esterase